MNENIVAPTLRGVFCSDDGQKTRNIARKIAMRLFAIIALLFVLFGSSARSEDPEYCYKGLEAHETGNYELAINDYTRCIDLGDLTVGNLAAAYFNRGNAYYDIGDFDQAILDYDDVIRLDLRGADAHTNRGLAYIKKDNHRQAIREFDMAISADPGFIPAYHNRCLALALMGRSKEALLDCNYSLRLIPNNPLSLDSRALAYWQLDEHDKARKDLERARQIAPSFATWQERFQQFEGMF